LDFWRIEHSARYRAYLGVSEDVAAVQFAVNLVLDFINILLFLLRSRPGPKATGHPDRSPCWWLNGKPVRKVGGQGPKRGPGGIALANMARRADEIEGEEIGPLSQGGSHLSAEERRAKLAEIDALITAGHMPERIAKAAGMPLAIVHARLRERMRAEVLLTEEEAAALGRCLPALEKAAKRQGVLPEVRSAIDKIEKLLMHN